MARADLSKLIGTKWAGTAELWLDPLGNEAQTSACTMAIEQDRIGYTWAYEGKPHEGTLTLGDGGLTWSDSWHQPQPVEAADVSGAWGLLSVHYTYGAGEGPDWGWRIGLYERPTGELVLQMTNITPWGEEARAVRMIFTTSS